MDKHKLVEKLRKKTNISYEEAKKVLENSNWDILDALLYLEESGKVEKPSVSIFYTNETRYTGEIQVIRNNEEYKYKTNSSFQGIFEAICKFIDTCNNIFLEIKKAKKIFLKIPLTVVILLSFFMFWIIIPLIIVGLFFDIEFYVYANSINTDKVNKILNEISKYVKDIKEKFKKGVKND
ncbi:ubiquitin [Clostridium sp. D46t1_190503_E9]|uniref:ubiquitin n=1 Tax=Clostridium sp. D46t1_190503_E9 TaxID=2787137 RepID=UPI001898AEA1|nr:ubiquitin [Clostridium sp. D46t1_190503_E9]